LNTTFAIEKDKNGNFTITGTEIEKQMDKTVDISQTLIYNNNLSIIDNAQDDNLKKSEVVKSKDGKLQMSIYETLRTEEDENSENIL